MNDFKSSHDENSIQPISGQTKADENVEQLPSQYDTTSAGYREIVQNDMVIDSVQQPEALRLLGDVANKTMLDVGCGEGKFLRRLSKLGARCVGYDISASQIESARQRELLEPQGITYIQSDTKQFSFPAEFDLASSTLVLLHAHDREELQGFFQSTFNALKDGGKFVSITYNPDYKQLDQIKYDRRFSKVENNEIKVDFFKPGETTPFTSALFGDLSKIDYEEAARNAGFSAFEWVPMQIHGDQTDEFWAGFLADCPYIGFVAYKGHTPSIPS